MKQTAFDEDLLRSYLLGELPEALQVRVEEAAFNDAETFAHLQAIENDLIDEYVRGELAGGAQRSFKQRFLNSEVRRRKIEFASALTRLEPASLKIAVNAPALAGDKATSRSAPAQNNSGSPSRNTPAGVLRWKSIFDSFARFPLAPRVSVVALVLILLICGALFFIIRQRGENKTAFNQSDQASPHPTPTSDIANNSTTTTQSVQPPVAVAPTPPPQALAQNPQPDNDDSSTKRSSIPPDRTQSASTPKSNPPTPSRPSIATLLFSSGITRGENEHAKRLVLLRTTTKAQFSFALEKSDEFRSYQVELRTINGLPVTQSIQLTAQASKRAGRALTLSVPASKLPAGSYEALLRGVDEAGRSQLIADYYFDVVRR